MRFTVRVCIYDGCVLSPARGEGCIVHRVCHHRSHYASAVRAAAVTAEVQIQIWVPPSMPAVFFRSWMAYRYENSCQVLSLKEASKTDNTHSINERQHACGQREESLARLPGVYVRFKLSRHKPTLRWTL